MQGGLHLFPASGQLALEEPTDNNFKNGEHIIRFMKITYSR